MSERTYAGYKPEDRRDYKGNIMAEPPSRYWGPIGQVHHIEDAIDRELEQSGGPRPQDTALHAAQARGEVALCAAFRAHPTRSRMATAYPQLVAQMTKYIHAKMVADIADRTDGGAPKNPGALEQTAGILGRIWAIGVLKMARL